MNEENALKLADELEEIEGGWGLADACCAELRRLYAENQADTALLRQALEALEYVGQNTPKFACGPGMDGIVTALRERLK